MTISWTAIDPQHDTLPYDIAISGDGGKTWKPIKKKWRAPVVLLPAVSKTPSKSAKPSTPEPAATKPPPSPPTDADVKQQVDAMAADLNNHPELPAAVRAQILAQAPTVIKKTGTASTPTPPDTGATNLKDTTFTWDSTEVPDGMYQIQVTASDRPSEPDAPMKGEAISGAFAVDNTPPTIKTDAPVIGADKTVAVSGTLASGLAFIKAVQFTVDGTGDPLAASAVDGMFDSATEPFKLTTLPLTSGAHKIEITAFDWAGNTATSTVSVTVP